LPCSLATGKTLNEEDTARLAVLVGGNKERKRLADVEADRLAEEERQRAAAAVAEAARLAAEEARLVAEAIEKRRQGSALSIQRVVRGFVGWCRARDRRVAKAAEALRATVASLLRLGVGGPMIVALSALATVDGTATKEAAALLGASPKSKHFQSSLKQMKAVGIPASGKSGTSSAAILATSTGAHETAMHFDS
jgi:hypothetical protein